MAAGVFGFFDRYTSETWESEMEMEDWLCEEGQCLEDISVWEMYGSDDILTISENDKFILLSSGLIAFASFIDWQCLSELCPTEVGNFDGVVGYNREYGHILRLPELELGDEFNLNIGMEGFGFPITVKVEEESDSFAVTIAFSLTAILLMLIAQL